ncbi:unnamed protein product [Echinostoma caproni]|uniref:Alpha_adaptinC2 domain-containing protein n=1 Tax=Echinostoma caproni TaxID=27848 RepID=A0A183AIG3_9TREM|nr:unnamed protein product [Echinostoma caproni]
MVKVGAYILGEFGNLIAGDPRSAPNVQFDLLHSKFHLCTPTTRQLMLSTYMKFINLFPEIKPQIQDVLMNDSNLRSSNIEIQQRAVEYLALSRTASDDFLAKVLEEMPPFPERESSILVKLKARNPNSEHTNTTKPDPSARSETMQSVKNDLVHPNSNATLGGEVDLLGLGSLSPAIPAQGTGMQNKGTPFAGDNLLVDILGTNGTTENGTAATGLMQADLSAAAVNKKEFVNLICRTSGILYEDRMIQIGFRSQSNRHLSRLTLFYGNKSPHALTSFQTQIHCPETSDLTGTGRALNIELQPGPNTIELDAQVQQIINVECYQPFTECAVLSLSFEPGQESQKIFHAQFAMDPTLVKNKLLGFGISVLQGIDPNPQNFVGAGILTVSTQEIGILVRLEPNTQAQRHLGTFRYYLVPRFANKRLRLPRVILSTSGNETLGGRAEFAIHRKTYRQAFTFC